MVEELLEYDFNIIGVYSYDIKIPNYSGSIDELITFKASDALKITQLDSNVLNNLSTKNISKLQLATQLNKDLIVLYDFSKGLNEKEIRYFNLLFKKLVKKYHKKIMIVSRDVNYLLSICDTIAVYKKKLLCISKDFFDMRLYNYMDMPNIVKFVKLANEKKVKLTYTNDILELIKDIYRRKNEN